MIADTPLLRIATVPLTHSPNTKYKTILITWVMTKQKICYEGKPSVVQKSKSSTAMSHLANIIGVLESGTNYILSSLPCHDFSFDLSSVIIEQRRDGSFLPIRHRKLVLWFVYFCSLIIMFLHSADCLVTCIRRKWFLISAWLSFKRES